LAFLPACLRREGFNILKQKIDNVDPNSAFSIFAQYYYEEEWIESKIFLYSIIRLRANFHATQAHKLIIQKKKLFKDNNKFLL